MQTYSTLKELAEGNNFPVPRIVKAFREETTVNGHRVRNGIDDEGNTTWWLELTAAPNLNREYGELIRAEGVARRAAQALSLEDAKALFTEKGVAAVDVARLTPEDKTAFLEWRANGPVLRDAPELETEDATEPLASEITKSWLTAIDGIGTKGAGDLLAALIPQGITTFEKLNAFGDLTAFPAIGKKNGENLRAALLQELGGVTASPEGSTGQKRAKIFGAIAAKLNDMERNFPFERAIEIVEERLNAGIYDKYSNAISSGGDGLENIAQSAALYCRGLSQMEALEAKKGNKPDPVINIHCPHCNGLFDRAPAGAYEGGEAQCLQDDCDDQRGNCGKAFWIVATPDGYSTHKTGPGVQDTGIAIADHGEALKETLEEVTLEPAPDSLSDGGSQNALSLFIKERLPDMVPAAERIHPALIGCKLFAKTETHSDAWHQARAAGVGSSDAGEILGLSPYSKAVDIWKSKLGEDQKRKPWLDDYAQFGTWFERYIREFCEAEHGIEIIDGADIGTLQSVEWPRALANIDGLDITHGVVEEYKTTTEKWTTIPAHYEAQVQHQMFVTGVNEVRLRQFVSPIDRKLVPSLLETMRALDVSADRRLADWLLEHGEVHTWIVERDQRYIDRMVAREKAFWTFVEMGIEPVESDPEGTVDLSDDPDVLSACTEFARLDEVYQACAMEFLKAEGIDAPKRGSINGAAEKALKASKSKARKAIEKAVALACDAGDRPKRLTIGGHSATYVDRGTHAYWNIYTGENDSVPF